MFKKDVYVFPMKNGWGVRRPRSSEPSKKYDNKNDAVSYGKRLAKEDKSELIILRKDGKIQDKQNYGDDSFPTKDKGLLTLFNKLKSIF